MWLGVFRSGISDLSLNAKRKNKHGLIKRNKQTIYCTVQRRGLKNFEKTKRKFHMMLGWKEREAHYRFGLCKSKLTSMWTPLSDLTSLFISLPTKPISFFFVQYFRSSLSHCWGKISPIWHKNYFKVRTPLSRFSFAYQTVMTRDHTMVKTGWLGDQKPLETTFKLFLRFIFIEYFYVNFYSFFPVMMSFFLVLWSTGAVS